MANESMGMQPAGSSSLPNPAALTLASLGDDDFELGYEAADPLLQVQLWGEASVSGPSEHQP